MLHVYFRLFKTFLGCDVSLGHVFTSSRGTGISLQHFLFDCACRFLLSILLLFLLHLILFIKSCWFSFENTLYIVPHICTLWMHLFPNLADIHILWYFQASWCYIQPTASKRFSHTAHDFCTSAYLGERNTRPLNYTQGTCGVLNDCWSGTSETLIRY